MYEKCLKNKVNKGTISKIIIDRITNALCTGELTPGEQLPSEMEIAEMMGVGRNSVREALKIMDAFGILEIKRADGIYIASGYKDSVIDPLLYGIVLEKGTVEKVMEFRHMFLQTVLLLDMQYVTESQIDHLKELRDVLEQKSGKADCSICEVYTAVIDFENHLIKICDNQMAARLSEALEKLCRKDTSEAIENILANRENVLISETADRIITILQRKDIVLLGETVKAIKNIHRRFSQKTSE